MKVLNRQIVKDVRIQVWADVTSPVNNAGTYNAVGDYIYNQVYKHGWNQIWPVWNYIWENI